VAGAAPTDVSLQSVFTLPVLTLLSSLFLLLSLLL